MRRVFGRQKKLDPNAPPQKPLHETVGENMQSREDVLNQRIQELDGQLGKLRLQIQRSNGPTRERYRREAMQILKRRRMYEQQRGMNANQQMSFEQMRFANDSMQDTTQQVQVMKETRKQLGKNLKHFSPDKVEDLQDDLTDLYEQHQEIQEIMGRSYDVENDYLDEDELDGELDALALEMETGADASYLTEAMEMPNTGFGQ